MGGSHRDRGGSDPRDVDLNIGEPEMGGLWLTAEERGELDAVLSLTIGAAEALAQSARRVRRVLYKSSSASRSR